MAKSRKNSSRPGDWVQDATLYIPPTSSVGNIPLDPEWEAVDAQKLAETLGLKDL